MLPGSVLSQSTLKDGAVIELTPGLVIVLLLVLAAEFVNGWTDAPNAIATEPSPPEVAGR